MIKGEFSAVSLPVILISLLRMRKSGRLTIHRGSSGFALYFEEGKLKYVTTLWARDGLAKVLVELGMMSRDDIDRLLLQESVHPLEQMLHHQKLLPVNDFTAVLEKTSAMVVRSLEVLGDGEFVFIPGLPPFPLPVKPISIISLVTTKVRQLQNLDDILPLLEPLDSYPELDRTSPGFQTLLKIKLDAHEGFVLSRIDSELDFNRIFTFCGGDRTETARFLLLLMFFDLLKLNKGAQYVQGEVHQQFKRFNELMAGGAEATGTFKAAVEIPQDNHRQTTQRTTPPANFSQSLTNGDGGDDSFSAASRANEEKMLREIGDKLVSFQTMNYYQILEVSPDASIAQIKQGYFQMAKRYHPDSFFRKLSKNDIEQVERIFSLIKTAYDTLSSETQKRQYDMSLRRDSQIPVLTDENKVASQRKTSSDYQYKQALQCISRREYDRALEFLSAARDFDPENPNVLAKMAETELLMGRQLTSAEKNINQALKLKPSEGMFHLLHAKILLRRKRLDDAERAVKKALLNIPEEPEVRKTMQAIREERQKIIDANKRGVFGKLFGK